MSFKRRTFVGSSAGLLGAGLTQKLFARQSPSPAASPEVPAAPAGVLTLNGDLAHSDVGFIAKHMVVGRVRGRFNNYSAEIVFDQDAPENSSVKATIDATSVDTKVAQRDDHLKSADFLEVEKYPEITFVSTAVTATDASNFVVTGDLTIKETTAPVEMTVVYNGHSFDGMTGHNYGYVAETTISLSAFGVKFMQPVASGGRMVGDELTIQILMEAHPAE